MKTQYGSRKKYHYLYKTTNVINGKFYYGMHSTDNLEDGYKGSGTLLRRSINKYGYDNFVIEILEFFETREALVEAEKKLVTEYQVSDSNCMNLKPGGRGGFTREQSDAARVLANAARIKKLKEDPEFREKYRDSLRKATTKRWESGEIPFGGFHYSWLGKKHKPETIEKMKQSAKGKQEKENNSQFNTKWITNGESSRKIGSAEDIPEGWKAGRVIKLRP